MPRKTEIQSNWQRRADTVLKRAGVKELPFSTAIKQRIALRDQIALALARAYGDGVRSTMRRYDSEGQYHG